MSQVCESPLIAVIDDDTAFISLMCELLSDEGYRVICGHNGKDAVLLIRNNQPDVVILNVRLEHPEAGWTILELLRLAPATKDLPVIICSADARFLQANEPQLRKHRGDILYKPFDLDELLEKLRAIVGPPCLQASEI